MAVVVEYLVMLRRSDTFCDSVESFNRLLAVDSNLAVSSGAIQFKGGKVGYQIKGGEVAGKEQRYFQLCFSLPGSNPDGDALDNLASCLKAVRAVIAQAGGQAEVLWDDISSSYSRKAYPLIHDIENLMRKLIANFMLITVGREWVKEAAPVDIKSALDKSKRKPTDSLNILHTLDFCHLGDVLFSKYSTHTVEDLHQLIRQAKKADDLDLASLQEYLPRSNWQRYFSTLVSCDDGYLSSRWKDLYDLRCLVAHNAMLTKGDLEKIERLVSEVKPKLVDAISKVPSVSVPPTEMEAVAESAVRNLNESLRCFIIEWNHLLGVLSRRAAERGVTVGPLPTIISVLTRERLIDSEMSQALNRLQQFRDRTIHGPLDSISPAVIDGALFVIRSLIRRLDAAGAGENPARCLTCGAADQWDGVRCLGCGRMSDD